VAALQAGVNISFVGIIAIGIIVNIDSCNKHND
jgi:hypothetical protein